MAGYLDAEFPRQRADYRILRPVGFDLGPGQPEIALFELTGARMIA